MRDIDHHSRCVMMAVDLLERARAAVEDGERSLAAILTAEAHALLALVSKESRAPDCPHLS